MRSKKLLALGSTLLLVAGLITLGATSAEAHTPTVSADCSTLSVNLKSYNTNGANTVTVTIDGSVVDSNSNFGASFVESYPFTPKTIAHTWKVDYTAWDDPTGSHGWSGSQSGTTTPCVSHDNDKVTLCHATPPDTAANGWNELTVSDAALVIKNGHATEHDADIIPAFDYWIKVQGAWTFHHFAGKNLATVWSGATGAEILANGCEIPDVKDATASISTTPATCSTAEMLVLGSISNATWGVPTLTTGPGSYSVTATAIAGHAFSNGFTTKVFLGTLAGVLSPTSEGCAPPPCLPKSAVSYTYVPGTNSGIITVTAMDGYSRTLCNPFWVTAASWTFDGNTTWPQTLDQWNPANSGNAIATVGTYPYGAEVGCGQGDIYATFTSPGVIHPSPNVLYGPSNPYAEHFLHQMGFSGPNPTYTQRNAATCNAVTAGVAFQGYQCNEFAPLVLTGTHVTFTVKYDDATPTATSVSGVLPGSYELLADFAAQTGDRYFGQVTVTVQADPGFTLLSVGTPVPLTAGTKVPTVVKTSTMQTTWVLDANKPQDCPVPVEVVPGASFTDLCGIDNDTYSAPSDTDEIDYTVVDDRVDGIGTVTVSAAPQTGYYFADGAYTGPWSHAFTSEDCTVDEFVAPDPADQTCSEVEEGGTVSGWIWVDLGGNLANEINYQITGGPSNVNFSATMETNFLEPGNYTVTATAKPGYKLDPNKQSVWNFTIGDAGTCTLITHPLISTTASSKNITCKADGSYTLAATEGVVWFVNGSSVPTAPGTYFVKSATTVNVEAQTSGPDYGWEDDAQTTWTFTFTDPVDCLPTLAYTGSDGGNLGLLLAGGFLLFGGTIVAFERRFRTNAK